MNDFFKKWKEDKKYRTKIKLIIYTLFVVFVSIYAFTLDTSSSNISNNTNDMKINTITKKETTNTINIPDEYEYTIKIDIDDKEYKYYGKKQLDKEIIQKIVDDTTTNYIYQNDKYYIEDTEENNNYIITTRDEVYDVINYNYINLNTINAYLSTSKKDYNQYLVYLKNIILGNDSEDYIIINITDNNIFIDYTILMKEFNKDVDKYNVIIEIKEKE